MSTANLPSTRQASYPIKKAAKAARPAKARRAPKPKAADIDRDDPKIQELEQVIQTIGAYMSQQIRKRAEDSGVEATVYFRVVLTKPEETLGENHGS